MTNTEHLLAIAAEVGVNVDELPDTLETTLLKNILICQGCDPETLPDNLRTTLLTAIAENMSGGGGSEGGTIVNPDKSGVIKFDDGTYVGRVRGGSRYFKLPYELFTTNPNAQIPYERLGNIICAPDPFGSYDPEEYNKQIEVCKGVPVEKDVDWTVDGTAVGCKDLWVECPPGSGEWIVPIIEVYTDTADYDGATLTRGLYAKAGGEFFFAESIEILPEQS